jgi:F-type H+-transporting ATPase subunit gamma
MSNLRDLRARKRSVQATRKITSAMKMIAAAKLTKAQKRAQDARPYARLMSAMLNDLLSTGYEEQGPSLLSGTGEDKTHLLVVAASNRGLCGGFNSQIVREAKKYIPRETAAGRHIKIICVGKRARDQLKQDYGHLILETFNAYDMPRFMDATHLSQHIITRFQAQEFDKCTLFYNKFLSALVYEPRHIALIPFTPLDEDIVSQDETIVGAQNSLYEYEPTQETVLKELLPQNLSVQLYRALLENAASEQGARMTAMDGATRNAGDMIHHLNLVINRTRQAQITSELVEIIAGAEAV